MLEVNLHCQRAVSQPTPFADKRGPSSAVLLPCPVGLRLLEFFHQLRLVQLLQVPDNAPKVEVGGDLGIDVGQKGDQLVALLGSKLMQKAGKGLGVTAAVTGQDVLQAAGGVGLVFSVFAQLDQQAPDLV